MGIECDDLGRKGKRVSRAKLALVPVLNAGRRSDGHAGERVRGDLMDERHHSLGGCSCLVVIVDGLVLMDLVFGLLLMVGLMGLLLVVLVVRLVVRLWLVVLLLLVLLMMMVAAVLWVLLHDGQANGLLHADRSSDG